jgi:hypothetical protein
MYKQIENKKKHKIKRKCLNLQSLINQPMHSPKQKKNIKKHEFFIYYMLFVSLIVILLVCLYDFSNIGNKINGSFLMKNLTNVERISTVNNNKQNANYK